MSYNSKKTIASITAGVLLTAAYVIYALSGSAPAPEDIQAWAVTMLVFIGIGVAAVIVVQILFHVAVVISITTKEKDKKTAKRVLNSTMLEDERDKAVAREASHVGYGMGGVGFCAVLISLAVGASVVLALHILFGAFLLGSLAEGAVSITLFERGTHNG